MSAAVPMGANLPRVERPVPDRSDDLISLLARRAVLGLAVGLALGASYFAAALPLVLDSDVDMFDTFRAICLRYAASITWLAILVTLAMQLPARVPFRIAAVALAIVAGRQLWQLLPRAYYPGYFELENYDGYRTYIHTLWLYLAMGVLFATYFFLDERMRRAQGALHEAQRAHQLAGQQVLESRLNVLRARVDPTFLFDALSASRRLYVERLSAGERLLDTLIEYLRAALPQARERASSLGDEVRLAHAYLEVAAEAQGRKLVLDADIDPRLVHAFFPPRILTPFVEDAARRARPAGGRLAIRAFLDGSRARVMLEDDGETGPEAGGVLRDLEMGLKAFFGPEAKAAVHRGLRGHALTLEYPWAGLRSEKEEA